MTIPKSIWCLCIDDKDESWGNSPFQVLNLTRRFRGTDSEYRVADLIERIQEDGRLELDQISLKYLTLWRSKDRSLDGSSPKLKLKQKLKAIRLDGDMIEELSASYLVEDLGILERELLLVKTLIPPFMKRRPAAKLILSTAL